MDLFEETRAILATLEEHEIDHAVVGAIALAIHGAPRATTDIDLLVRRETVEEILGIVRGLGFEFEALPMRFSDSMEVRRVSKIVDGETLTLDLILVTDNLAEAWNSRRRLAAELGGAWVVSREALIGMKVWAGRDQDLADVQRLKDLDR